MTNGLNGATALVVGGTGGIGLATAQRFAAAGARVAIAGRDRARGETALAALSGDGAEGVFLTLDVTDPASVSCMRTQGHGTIVNMAGNWGLVGFPNFAPYCAAAHGIVGLTKAAALEVAGAGLRVNAVCPGAVDAPMLDRMVGGDPAIKTSFGDSLAIGRICTPEEVANAVVWLCSPESSYVNGASLPLDGGGTA